MRPGVTMNDLKNLKKAFLYLDKENKGYINYDANKISDCRDY